MCLKHSGGALEAVPPFTSLFLDQSSRKPNSDLQVNTVLGPVAANQLGVTLVSETLLNILPGAEYAYDITLDRAEIFAALEAKLMVFKRAGGGALVDSSGMFQGRDLRLYEALSRTTGVHLVATSGQGPEAMLGGYFLTPQTNPPTPWPAQKFAELFGREVNEGMVVPRLERRAPAGMICTAVTANGKTPTDINLIRGAARAGAAYGVPVMVRCGSDAPAEMQLALDEALPAQRLVIGSLDSRLAVAQNWPKQIAAAGAYVGIDHIGSNSADYLDDVERVALILDLLEAGYAERLLLSSSATGVSFGEPGKDLPYSYVLTNFVPQLQAAGVSEQHLEQILVTNTAQLLSVSGGVK